MSPWVSGCGRLYRRLARAFPHEFRMICGDGLEQLGEDIVPLVWREQGVVGLMRLFGDLALHLPLEYLSTWIGRLKEFTMTGDLFEGTWKAKNDKSQWDPALHAGAGVPAVRSHGGGLPPGGVWDQGWPGRRGTSHVDHRGREASSDCRSERPSDSRRSAGRGGVRKPTRSPDDRSGGRGRRKGAGQGNLQGVGRWQDAHCDDGRHGPQGAVQGVGGLRARRPNTRTCLKVDCS